MKIDGVGGLWDWRGMIGRFGRRDASPAATVAIKSVRAPCPRPVRTPDSARDQVPGTRVSADHLRSGVSGRGELGPIAQARLATQTWVGVARVCARNRGLATIRAAGAASTHSRVRVRRPSAGKRTGRSALVANHRPSVRAFSASPTSKGETRLGRRGRDLRSGIARSNSSRFRRTRCAGSGPRRPGKAGRTDRASRSRVETR